MKKEFNPTVRIIASPAIFTTGDGENITNQSSTPISQIFGAPSRSAAPTTVNGVLGQVADQK